MLGARRLICAASSSRSCKCCKQRVQQLESRRVRGLELLICDPSWGTSWYGLHRCRCKVDPITAPDATGQTLHIEPRVSACGQEKAEVQDEIAEALATLPERPPKAPRLEIMFGVSSGATARPHQGFWHLAGWTRVARSSRATSEVQGARNSSPDFAGFGREKGGLAM